LPNFCFPYGLALKRIQPEKRHQILTKNYDENCDIDKERFFIVTINTENTYNENYGSKLLESINPHHILYCISLSIDDYFCKVKHINYNYNYFQINYRTEKISGWCQKSIHF